MINYLVVGVCLQISFLAVVVGEVVFVVDRMDWWDRVVPYTDAEDYVQILFEIVCVVGAMSFYASYVARWVMAAAARRKFLDDRLIYDQRAFVLWVVCRWLFFLYALYINNQVVILNAYWQETFLMAGWLLARNL